MIEGEGWHFLPIGRPSLYSAQLGTPAVQELGAVLTGPRSVLRVFEVRDPPDSAEGGVTATASSTQRQNLEVAVGERAVEGGRTGGGQGRARVCVRGSSREGAWEKFHRGVLH